MLNEEERKDSVIIKRKNNWFYNKFNEVKDFFKEVPSNYKKAFDLLLIISVIFIFAICVYPFTYNTFYNCNSDDIAQYYPFVAGFFERIKTGTLSLYDTSLFGGASFFASTYYIPIDIFLALAFVLSFIMSVERAYFITIILKMICGGLLMFYVLKRKQFKPLVCLVIGMAYMVTGLFQSYIIFPVYLGINVYVPIAILLTELFFDDDKKYLSYYLIPIFVVVLVLFDFYCAYMILAFMSFYFLMQCHIRLKSNLFFIKKRFFINFAYFFSFILLGVLLSACFMIPSALYILNESSRSSSTADYFWVYSKISNKAPESIDYISWSHYFTQLINIYIPNNPAELCLVPAGGYVREHATLYMTCGVLIYLVKFIFSKGNGKVKFWIILFNILYLMPIFAMIFTFTKQGYLRWFFIPFTFNMIGAAIGMNDSSFKLGEAKFSNACAILSIFLGFVLVVFTLITNTELFIHYDKEKRGEYLFIGILIPSIIFFIIYFVLILIPFISRYFRKNLDLLYKAMPLMIFLELIFSIVIVVSSIGSTSYSKEYKNSNSKINYLRTHSDYNFSDGYRINLYTDQKCTANNNTMFLNVNCTNFFQSFYNTALDTYFQDVNMVNKLGWSRRSMYGYSLLNAPMYNNKYVITNDYVLTSQFTGKDEAIRPVVLPSKYYKNYGKANSANYYGLTNLPQFIVYDSIYYKNSLMAGESTFLNDYVTLNHGYAKMPNKIISQMSGKANIGEVLREYDNIINTLEKDDQKQLANLKTIYDSGIDIITKEDAYAEVKKEEGKKYKALSISNGKYNQGTGYLTYDLSNYNTNKVFNDFDAIYVYPYDPDIAAVSPSVSRYWMYLGSDEIDSNGNYQLYPFHYNVGYISEMKNLNQERLVPTRFLMKTSNQYDSYKVILYGFNYSIYDDFINKQNTYQNREFSINGSNMHIAFKNDSNTKVIKTAYAYSEDWQIVNNNKNYKTVDIDGGFLGIIVPKNIENVDITLRYSPQGLTMGLKISALGSIIYVTITSVLLSFEVKKRIKGKEFDYRCKQSH